MGIRYLSENIIFVTLPKKPHLGSELNNVNEIASDGCDCDVIIDFSRAKILTSASISNLMLLKDFLSAHNHQLILCNVSTLIKYIFTRLSLEPFFEFSDEKFSEGSHLKSGGLGKRIVSCGMSIVRKRW